MGISLCRTGHYKEGINRLHHFEMMAKAKLHEIPCPADDTEEKIQQLQEYIFYACGGASELLKQGEIEMKRLNTIPSIIKSCD